MTNMHKTTKQMLTGKSKATERQRLQTLGSLLGDDTLRVLNPDDALREITLSGPDR